MSERIRKTLGLVAVAGCASIAQAGPDWVEGDHGEAGSLPKVAQPINMSASPTGEITKISGRLNGAATGLGQTADDFEDMYRFRVLVPTLFCATTTCFDEKNLCGFAQFDSKLWLFDSKGNGLLGNDDTSVLTLGGGSVDGSTLTGQSCDGTDVFLLPGEYYFAISGFNFPASQNGEIFCFGCTPSGSPTCALGPTEVSGPDGPGGGLPITQWQNNLLNIGASAGPCFGCGDYEIAICMRSVGIVVDTVEAKMDIKPGGCPNPFNRTSNGVLPVSLLGTASFDVHDVNLSTVRIGRADGMGGVLAPNEGPPGPHSVFDDTGTPYTGNDCGCHELEGDGIVDLSMKFKSASLVSQLQLNNLPAGAVVPLKLTGQLTDGTDFEAEDCIRLVPPGTPPGMMAVAAPAAAYIESSPMDLALDTGGFGNFQRTFPVTTVVTLSAPAMLPGKMFAGWRIDGNAQLVPNATLQLTVTSATHTYEAVYVSVNIAR